MPGGRVELSTNPKAFGAALPLKMVNREAWIFLSL